MGKHVYTGLATELNGKPIKVGDSVDLTDEQVRVLREHGHSFAEDATEEPKPTPQDVDAAFNEKTGEADLSKASKAEKKA